MPRYITIPKQDRDSDIPNPATACFGMEARESQISRLLSIRREQARRKPLLTSLGPDYRVSELPLTGIHLIDTDADGGELLAEALPSHDIFEDEPLHLVEPVFCGAPLSDPNDLWHLDAIGLTAARSAGLQNKGNGVGVAVLDTGILEVPEIGGRVKASYTLNGQNWTQVNAHDTHGHGTHVAGLVAGSQVGVAPGVELTNIIMIPSGHGRLSDFVSALEFVAAMPDISIVNMSAGIARHGWPVRELERNVDGHPARERSGSAHYREQSYHHTLSARGRTTTGASRASRCTGGPPRRRACKAPGGAVALTIA